MTAYAQPYQNGGGSRFLLIIVLAVALLGAVLLGTHATERHGAEAEMIRQTCHQNGPDEVWQSLKTPDVFVWLVNLTNGKWGCWFLQNWPSQGAQARELTGFCPKDGSYQRVVCYLERALFERVK